MRQSADDAPALPSLNHIGIRRSSSPSRRFYWSAVAKSSIVILLWQRVTKRAVSANMAGINASSATGAGESHH